LTSAYLLLLNYKTPFVPAPTPRRDNRDRDGEAANVGGFVSGMTFANITQVPGTDGVIHAGKTCYSCQGIGHYADRCPKSETAANGATGAVTLLQSTEDEAEPGNNEATVSHFTFVNVETAEFVECHDFSFYQNHPADRAALIPESWVLLDSQSTASIFKNPRLVKNIRKSDRTLICHTNGGIQMSNKEADVNNYG
jgi:hypothetical protein